MRRCQEWAAFVLRGLGLAENKKGLSFGECLVFMKRGYYKTTQTDGVNERF